METGKEKKMKKGKKMRKKKGEKENLAWRRQKEKEKGFDSQCSDGRKSLVRELKFI